MSLPIPLSTQNEETIMLQRWVPSAGMVTAALAAGLLVPNQLHAGPPARGAGAPAGGNHGSYPGDRPGYGASPRYYGGSPGAYYRPYSPRSFRISLGAPYGRAF